MNTGIYKITNLKNNKFYIGSSISSLKKRLQHHKNKLENNIHKNNYLQNSYNKYGVDNFKFEIIEFLEPEYCRFKEQYYLDNYKCHYNINRCATGGHGGSLTKEDILDIFKLSKAGFKPLKISEFKNITRNIVQQVLARKNYLYIDVPDYLVDFVNKNKKIRLTAEDDLKCFETRNLGNTWKQCSEILGFKMSTIRKAYQRAETLKLIKNGK